MSTPANPIPTPAQARGQFVGKLHLVSDAIGRITDQGFTDDMQPRHWAYIDGQLAQIINWLASCRSIAMAQGGHQKALFDTGAVVDLDADGTVAEALGTEFGRGMQL